MTIKQKPVAEFSYTSPTPTTTDDTVYFTDSSYAPEGNITSWSWDFGDGLISDSQNPTHQYQNYGTYTVTLQVTDDNGYIGVSTTNIIVMERPTAQFSFLPTAPKLADTIQFTDLSNAYNGTIVSWSWNFGDGGTSIEKNPTHKYQTYGTYTISLQVTDSNGLTRTKTASIIFIQNKPPSPDFSSSPSTPTTADTVQFMDLSYDTDGTVTAWSWNFGDGTSSTEKNPTHLYQKSGTYQVNLQVTDNDGTSNLKTASIIIKDKGIPGFELITAICAIGLVLFLRQQLKKKNE